METETYERWWALHLRVAKGEALNEAEFALYNAGLEEQYLAEEEINEDLIKRLQLLRARLDMLADENRSLHRQEAQLDEKIAVLESAYQHLTGQPITSVSYATR
jgi:predicted nuclease with TOPRIM domain